MFAARFYSLYVPHVCAKHVCASSAGTVNLLSACCAGHAGGTNCHPCVIFLLTHLCLECAACLCASRCCQWYASVCVEKCRAQDVMRSLAPGRHGTPGQAITNVTSGEGAAAGRAAAHGPGAGRYAEIMRRQGAASRDDISAAVLVEGDSTDLQDQVGQLTQLQIRVHVVEAGQCLTGQFPGGNASVMRELMGRCGSSCSFEWDAGSAVARLQFFSMTGQRHADLEGSQSAKDACQRGLVQILCARLIPYACTNTAGVCKASNICSSVAAQFCATVLR
jgi:hypothetical protein